MECGTLTSGCSGTTLAHLAPRITHVEAERTLLFDEATTAVATCFADASRPTRKRAISNWGARKREKARREGEGGEGEREKGHLRLKLEIHATSCCLAALPHRCVSPGSGHHWSRSATVSRSYHGDLDDERCWPSVAGKQKSTAEGGEPAVAVRQRRERGEGERTRTIRSGTKRVYEQTANEQADDARITHYNSKDQCLPCSPVRGDRWCRQAPHHAESSLARNVPLQPKHSAVTVALRSERAHRSEHPLPPARWLAGAARMRPRAAIERARS